MDEATLDRALFAAARRHQDGGHPSADELAAHAAGELAEEEREGLEEHLARCPECASVVRDLAAFPALEPPPGTPARDDERVQAAWERLAGTLGEESAGGGDDERPRVLRWPPARGGFWAPLPWAIAAALLLATVSLALWGVHLQRSLARLADARINVPVVELVPAGAAAERGAAGERLAVPSGGRSAVFLLELGDLRPFTQYRVELVANGEPVWSRSGLRPVGDGRFTLELPLRLLAPGRYELRLSGLADGDETPLARYLFTVSAGPARSTQISIGQ
jgi:hypothetical protein